MARARPFLQNAVLLARRMAQSIDLPATIGMILVILFVFWLMRDYWVGIST